MTGYSLWGVETVFRGHWIFLNRNGSKNGSMSCKDAAKLKYLIVSSKKSWPYGKP